MATTIQINHDLLNTLKSRKLYDRESYEEVIWDLIEDVTEVSKETKVLIRQAEADIKEGRTHSLEKVKKELGLNV